MSKDKVDVSGDIIFFGTMAVARVNPYINASARCGFQKAITDEHVKLDAFQSAVLKFANQKAKVSMITIAELEQVLEDAEKEVYK